jgi:hypothetical protein
MAMTLRLTDEETALLRRHLTVEDLLIIAEATVGQPAVRDIGLLDSAAHRPRASAFGNDAYPTVDQKAAALLEAIVRDHALGEVGAQALNFQPRATRSGVRPGATPVLG